MSSSESTPSYPTPTFTPPPIDDGAGEADHPASSPRQPWPPEATVRSNGTQYDDDELEAFRREWQNEVRRRRGESILPQTSPSQRMPMTSGEAALGGSSQGDHDDDRESIPAYHHRSTIPKSSEVASTSSDEDAQPHSPSRTRHLLQLADDQRRVALEEAASQGKSLPTSPISSLPLQKLNQEAPTNASTFKKSQMKAAVQAYALGAEMERKGHFDLATQHYRKAFRLDSNSDKLYERARALMNQQQHRFDGKQVEDMRSSSASSSSRSAWDAQSDALLASSEVGEMIRRATEFDDSRVIAIEKVQKKQGENGKRTSVKSNIREEKANGALRESDLSGACVDADDNQLESIIAEAATAVEGRDLSRISFQSPPALVKMLKPPNSSNSNGQHEIESMTEQLGTTHLEGGQGESEQGPPPPIARLPDELLVLICRLVAEPRGVRGAKIKPPKLEGVGSDKHAGQKNGTKADDKASKDKVKPSSANDGVATRFSKGSPAGVGVVLGGPDWQSLEMLARVSWKWRLTTRTTSIWNMIVSETYRPPQLPIALSPFSHSSPRNLFIHHPRVRQTGCYIAACHYTRPGLSVDNPWVKVIHLVEFYRSIRFLPDGKALTLLTTDPPKETVAKMHSANGDRGFAVGRWRVEMDSSDEEEEDASNGKEKRRQKGGSSRGGGGAKARVIIEDLKDRHMSTYSFRLILSLRCTSRGRWNKLEMLEYSSINLHTGEVLPLPRKHDRPFHFSAVRSYGV